MSCVRANRIAMNEPNQEVAHNVTYYDRTAEKTMSLTKVYRAISSEGYTTKNILISTVPREGNNIYAVAYAGPECAILRDDGNSNGTFKACELWVRESPSKNPAPCCDFIFDLLCSTGYKLITYYEPVCTADDEQ
ncbi:uncharacterized protein LOC121836039 [Ixodes scapularis]|uniref:uncharacterized protein LOC121836039 n=1 Tax=Ixodes scapularis TaxID=6945 RepID=UPI001C393E13|nr:uncharacterized protein LOC121836039 [Ixodes scapularis]